MLPEVSTIARIQVLDEQTHTLQVKLADLPRQVAAQKKTVEDAKRKLEASQAELAAAEKERRGCENEIVLRQSKLKKLKTQIEHAANDTQYQAFQHEIDFCLAEVSKNEDRTLELMELTEQLEPRIKIEQAALSGAQKVAADHFKEAEQFHRSAQQQIVQNNAQHKELLAGLPENFSLLYERLRRKYKSGPVLCEAKDGHCTICQMVIRMAFWQNMKGDPDKLYQCEECSRIIHYNPTIIISA